MRNQLLRRSQNSCSSGFCSLLRKQIITPHTGRDTGLNIPGLIPQGYRGRHVDIPARLSLTEQAGIRLAIFVLQPGAMEDIQHRNPFFREALPQIHGKYSVVSLAEIAALNTGLIRDNDDIVSGGHRSPAALHNTGYPLKILRPVNVVSVYVYRAVSIQEKDASFTHT